MAVSLGGLAAFTVKYLKAEAGMQVNQIMFASAAKFVGALGTLWFLKTRLDRLGSRPVILFGIIIGLMCVLLFGLIAGRVMSLNFYIVAGLYFSFGFVCFVFLLLLFLFFLSFYFRKKPFKTILYYLIKELYT